MLIRPFCSEDAELAERLFHLSFGEDNLLELLKRDRYGFAYSAYTKEELAAVMIGWKSSFHTNCTYIKIVSNPELANDELLKSLIAEVERQEVLSYPLQTSVWETAAGLKFVYKVTGFTEIRRTYMPQLFLSNVLIKDPPIKVFDGQVVLSIAELSNEARMQVVSLAKQIYEETHQANPPADKSVSEWEQLVLAEDLILDGSFVCIDNKTQQIIAFSFIHDSDKDGVYELGWCGCIEETDLSILSELVKHQLYYSAAQNIRCLEGEFDTTDRYAMEVMKRFPFAPCPTLITYQKK